MTNDPRTGLIAAVTAKAKDDLEVLVFAEWRFVATDKQKNINGRVEVERWMEGRWRRPDFGGALIVVPFLYTGDDSHITSMSVEKLLTLKEPGIYRMALEISFKVVVPGESAVPPKNCRNVTYSNIVEVDGE